MNDIPSVLVFVDVDNKSKYEELFTAVFPELEIVFVDSVCEFLKSFVLNDYNLVVLASSSKFINPWSIVAILRNTKVPGYKRSPLFYVVVNKKAKSLSVKVDEVFYSFNQLKKALPSLRRNFYQHYELTTFESFIEKKNFTSEEKILYDLVSSLPKFVNFPLFSVSYIYSPYSFLGGDLFDFWSDSSGTVLNGVLYDCVGHDKSSFSYLSVLKTIYTYCDISCKMSQKADLGSLMNLINKKVFKDFQNQPQPCCIFSFSIDFSKQEIRFCSAGIPFVFLGSFDNNFNQLFVANPVIGSFDDLDYHEQSLSIKNFKYILLCTDGFSDLVNKSVDDLDVVKDDDVTLLIIENKMMEGK